MKKFFPLLLAIAVGLGGYLYFNQKIVSTSGIEQINIYHNDDYNDKNLSPFIKLEKQKFIKIVINTINSAETTDREMNSTPQNLVLDIVYSKDKKETFWLWLNENTTSAMYTKQNKDDMSFHILSKKDTNKLKTLIFR